MLSPLDWPAAVAIALAERTDRRLERLGAVTLACAAAVIALLGAWIVFSGVPTVRGVDLNVVLTIQKAMLGQALYTDTAAPPFDVAQYAPLFYLATLGLSRVLGIGSDQPAAILVLARSLSLLSTLASIALLIRFGTRAFQLPRGLLVAAAAFALITTAPWLFLARPDAMALAVTMAAFMLMARSAAEAGGTGTAAMAAVLAVTALFTKQSAIQLLPIAVLFYALLGRWASCAAFGAVYVTAAVGAWSLATWQWPAFAANVIGGVDNGVSLFNAFDKTYAEFFPLHGGLLAMLLIGLARWVRKPLVWQAAFFLAVLPGLLVVATGTALKEGSAANYYNEFLFVAVLGAAKLLHEARRDTREGAGSLTLEPLRIVAAFFICWLPFHVVMEVRDSWWKRITPGISLIIPADSLWSRDYERLRAVVDDALGEGGPRWVLAFPLPTNTAIPQRILVPQKEVASLLFHRGVVDYALFRDLIARDQVGLILASAADPRPPVEFLGVTMPPVSSIAVVGPFRVYRVLPGGGVAPRH